ncbi:MAG: metallophosphoesterase [bacterium]
MKILHLSDIHFGVFKFKPGILASKRVLGMINYLLRRKKIYTYSCARELGAFIEKKHIEYIVVTGDFTTTSMEAEYKMAQEYLQGLSKYVKGIFVVPGNHDAYIPEAVKAGLFQKYFSKWTGEPMVKNQEWPYYRNLDQGILILGINSALPMIFYSAQGFLHKEEIKQIDQFLQKTPAKFKIVINHYPLRLPPDQPAGLAKNLINGDMLLQVLKQNKVNLYLHGHMDRQWFVPQENNFPVLANSGSLTHNGKESFVIYDIFSSKKICCEMYKYSAARGWYRSESVNFEF